MILKRNLGGNLLVTKCGERWGGLDKLRAGIVF